MSVGESSYLALGDRLRRFDESGDPSILLDSVALSEAAQLWEIVQGADNGARELPEDYLTVLAYFHFFRFQVLPGDEGEEDLQAALGLFDVLSAVAPDRVPDELRQHQPGSREEEAGDGAKLTGGGGGGWGQ